MLLWKFLKILDVYLSCIKSSFHKCQYISHESDYTNKIEQVSKYIAKGIIILNEIKIANLYCLIREIFHGDALVATIQNDSKAIKWH